MIVNCLQAVNCLPPFVVFASILWQCCVWRRDARTLPTCTHGKSFRDTAGRYSSRIKNLKETEIEPNRTRTGYNVNPFGTCARMTATQLESTERKRETKTGKYFDANKSWICRADSGIGNTRHQMVHVFCSQSSLIPNFWRKSWSMVCFLPLISFSNLSLGSFLALCSGDEDSELAFPFRSRFVYTLMGRLVGGRGRASHSSTDVFKK